MEAVGWFLIGIAFTASVAYLVAIAKHDPTKKE